MGTALRKLFRLNLLAAGKRLKALLAEREGRESTLNAPPSTSTWVQWVPWHYSSTAGQLGSWEASTAWNLEFPSCQKQGVVWGCSASAQREPPASLRASSSPPLMRREGLPACLRFGSPDLQPSLAMLVCDQAAIQGMLALGF